MPDNRPVILAGCQIKIDLDQKLSPEIRCGYDRERTVNPELQEGLVCKPEFSSSEKDRKLYLRFEMVCRPPGRVFRQLKHAPNDKVMKELRELLKHQQPSPRPVKPLAPSLQGILT